MSVLAVIVCGCSSVSRKSLPKEVSMKVLNPDGSHPVTVQDMIIYADKPNPVEHR